MSGQFKNQVNSFGQYHLADALSLFFACALGIPAFASWNNIVNILYHTTIMSMLVLAQGFVLLNGNFDLSIDAVLAFAPGVVILASTKWFPARVG